MRSTQTTRRPSAAEYVNALIESPKFGPQVVIKKTDNEKVQKLADKEPPLDKDLRRHLESLGINRLYSHQQEAIELLKKGKDIIVSTPTASGKSMIYNLPVVEMLIEEPHATALYLFPLKALAQDQLRVFNEFSELLDSKKTYAAIYDGDTSSYRRRRIREEQVPVLMTNPEMLHLSLLPYHGNWIVFFKNLKIIVLDEVHTYRGVLGSHMAWVLRRLLRICSYYGSSPRIVMLSATIGNPAELGAKLTGREPVVIDKSGAPTGTKHTVLLNPWDSAPYTASQLLEAAMKRELRSIVYTQSRKLTELINLWTKPRLGKLEDKLSSYRAGFLPEERREVEHMLSNGKLYGVISTSALELGIDIGDLDVCVLVGYPGSIMSMRQRGGRVGRSFNESVIVMIAQEDALDQYFMRQPKDFFNRDVESAVLNPENETIMGLHLQCAAAETPLQGDDPLIKGAAAKSCIESLTKQGLLLQAGDGDSWFSPRKYPQRQVSLRGSGNQLAIVDGESGEIIGEIDSGRAMKECHPVAVYLHHARTWIVAKLDLEGKEAIVLKKKPSYSTRPTSSKNTTILSTEKSVMSFQARVSYGRLRVTERVTGFQKRNNATHKLIGTYPLEMEEQIMETRGLWLELPPAVRKKIENDKIHFMGGIHAMEHAMIALFPLLALCDRNDIGGISCPTHEQTGEATIFIYDGHAGGVGLAETVFNKMELLLQETCTMVKSCECENGCPSCVHSPKCGSGNRPIDKAACLKILELLFADQPPQFTNELTYQGEDTAAAENGLPDNSEDMEEELSGLDVLPDRWGVFDLETIRSAEEVGGWHRADRMGISVAVVYDSMMDGYVTYLEHEIDALLSHLRELDLVIGFNNKRFDNRVLSGYPDGDISRLPSLDLLEEVTSYLGYRLSLDRLAEHSLGVKKSGDGLQALAWYKEGRIDLIQKYCKKDVEITKDLFLSGLENSFYLFKNKAGKLVRLPLRLDKSIKKSLSK